MPFTPDPQQIPGATPGFKPDPVSPDSADKAAQGGSPNAKPISTAHPPSLYTFAKGGMPEDSAVPDVQGDAIDRLKTTGKIAAAAGTMAFMPEVEGAGVLNGISKALTNGGAAGLQKYFSNLIDQKQDPTEGVLGNTALGSGISLAGEVPGAMSNVAKNWANGSMKRAVGLVGAAGKNAPSDIGNRMVDMGLWGTKSGLASQVADKYSKVEGNIQELANSLEGNVSGKDLSDAVRQEADRFVDPMTGKPFSAGEEGNAAINRVADQLETRAPGYSAGSPEQTSTNYIVDGGEKVPMGETTTQAVPAQQGNYQGPGLLRLKRLGDEQAFNQSGAMGNTYAAEAYRAQADAARGALSDLSGGEMPKALRDEQTLLYANKGLNKPVMTGKNPWNFSDLIGADIGGHLGGLPGAVTGVVTEHGALSPLAQSLWAHGLQKVAAPTLGAASQISNPAVLQSLFGLSNASSGGQ